MAHFHFVHVGFKRLLFCSVFCILFKSSFCLLVIMTQYHLGLLPSRDYVAMNAGDELDENEEFHDSFDFPQETAPPGTSTGNPSGQSSMPLALNRGPNGSQGKIAELTTAVAWAKAENNELELRAEVTKSKAKLHVLCKRNAHLQSQTACVDAVSNWTYGGSGALCDH